MGAYRPVTVLDSLKTVVFILLVLWMMLVLGYILPLADFGIQPRTAPGLIGILCAPFIHAGPDHLVTNSISLLILGPIFMVMERRLSFEIILYIILLSGLGTWLIGRAEFTHIGASGVVYGLLGYLLAAGIFKRNIKEILVSILVFVLYGGAIWGIFPTTGFVSWESHLSGFLSGIAVAKIYSDRCR